MISKIRIVIGSAHRGRASLPIAQWVREIIEKDHRFHSQLIDLAKFDLPEINEHETNDDALPVSEQPEVMRWAEAIDEADAFIFVVSEKNLSAPSSIVAAINLLNNEWNYKPVAFISYGGISGGLQAALSLMPTLMGLKMHPIPEVISIPLVQQYVRDGHLKSLFFEAQDSHTQSAEKVLDELYHWSEALQIIRAKQNPNAIPDIHTED